MEIMTIKDLQFKPYLEANAIDEAIDKMAYEINRDYAGTKPVFVCVLNGAFMFASDLMKKIDIDCEIIFVRLQSYEGTSSTGKVLEVIGVQKEDIQDQHIIILEDIIDTGNTMIKFLPQVESYNPGSVKIASLLVKPDALKYPIDIHYRGFDIPNRFIVGYGLDYDGLGRNLKDIYQLVD